MSTLRRELPTAVYAAPAMAFGSARVCSMAVGDNLSNALNNLKLDDSSQKSFMVPRSKANQHRQRRQLLNGAASTNPNNANIHHSIKKIISRISNIELSGPVHANTPKRAAATLPSTTLHPYSRPARSTARRIQESRGLNLEKPRAEPDVPVGERALRGPRNPCPRIVESTLDSTPYKSTSRPTEVVDDMLALLNRPPTPEASSPVKRANAWIATEKFSLPTPATEPKPKTPERTTTSGPTFFNIEAFVHKVRTGVINEPAFVALREEEPRRDVGKVGNSRVKETRKNTPYSKEKPARVRKASKTKNTPTYINAVPDSNIFSPEPIAPGPSKRKASRKMRTKIQKALREDSGYEAEAEEDQPTYMAVDT